MGFLYLGIDLCFLLMEVSSTLATFYVRHFKLKAYPYFYNAILHLFLPLLQMQTFNLTVTPFFE